ncbi:hypothetical protein PISMIDRAFT_99107 [Pisolithus microcarpus 441]|uniref:Uncharacterized protein n=1 Tax=Pisolithus microcarpus 441 TaxID=765257 RepID=A0A0C9YGV1_9AGAM|nr:hypothetical protein BKA83DRAFT_99107 [Pisolithus microcarpus]KIK24175.1 hypothetical protein PISMIDRAFT_99107 [Pisolithus microcarpus 441]
MTDVTGQLVSTHKSHPFLAVLSLEGPRGKCVRCLAMVNSRAMINAINLEAHQRVARRLVGLSPSMQTLRMAGGLLVKSKGMWSGKVQWGPTMVETSFKVFLSSGAWRMLVGKPILDKVKAIHNYGLDSIILPCQSSRHKVTNFTQKAIPEHVLPT